jgi:hypothetical protein
VFIIDDAIIPAMRSLTTSYCSTVHVALVCVSEPNLTATASSQQGIMIRAATFFKATGGPAVCADPGGGGGGGGGGRPGNARNDGSLAAFGRPVVGVGAPDESIE